MRAGLLHQHLATLQLTALTTIDTGLRQGLQFERYAQQALPDQQGALAFDLTQRHQVVGHQGERAVGQALAVLAGTHLVEQVHTEHPEHSHQHQRGEHAAIDPQENRVHRTWPMASAASRTNR
ncbi:hypothetical protein D3C80_1233120 [compost metagenome]